MLKSFSHYHVQWKGCGLMVQCTHLASSSHWKAESKTTTLVLKQWHSHHGSLDYLANSTYYIMHKMRLDSGNWFHNSIVGGLYTYGTSFTLLMHQFYSYLPFSSPAPWPWQSHADTCNNLPPNYRFLGNWETCRFFRTCFPFVKLHPLPSVRRKNILKFSVTVRFMEHMWIPRSPQNFLCDFRSIHKPFHISLADSYAGMMVWYLSTNRIMSQQ